MIIGIIFVYIIFFDTITMTTENDNKVLLTSTSPKEVIITESGFGKIIVIKFYTYDKLYISVVNFVVLFGWGAKY